MATTDNLAITLVEQSQSQKEVTVNEALVALDALMNTGVIDQDLTAPPGSPANGDLYIVASGGTGDWSGHDNEIAWFNQVWKFIAPAEGLTLWVRDEDALFTWNGSAWVNTIQALSTPQFTRIGLGTAPDGTHIVNLFGPSILYNAANGFTQQMNKNAAGDDLKLLFQQGFTTYAELGLLGDNEFSLKTSDGVTFNLAWKIRQSGVTNFEKEALISEYAPINHKNYIVNGDCKIAERSDFTLVKDVYGYGRVDRFQGMATGTLVSAGNFTHSAFSGKDYVKFGGVTLTGAGELYVRYRIEAQDAEIFNSQKASFQCSIFHDVGTAIDATVFVRKADSSDDFSAVTAISDSGAISVPDSNETIIRFEDIDMGTCENGIEIELKLEPGAITTKEFLIRRFQFELGSFATQFVHEAYGTTLQKCQRFYQKHGRGINGAFSSSTEIDVALYFPVEMRTTPTETLLDTTPFINHTGVGGKTGSSSSIVGGGTSLSAKGAYVRIDGFTGGTSRDPVFIGDDNVIGFDADFPTT